MFITPLDQQTTCCRAGWAPLGIPLGGYGYDHDGAGDDDAMFCSASDPCCMGCLLDLDATPARVTVFVDGAHWFTDHDKRNGRMWYPTVQLSLMACFSMPC